MSRKKGAGIAAIIFVAAIGGLVAYSAMPRQQEPGPAPVLTTIDRQNESGNGSVSIAENPEGQPQDSDSVIANNTIVINKPVYRNNTIIYQPVTINLENYRSTINQHVKLENNDGASQPADKSHSITVHAKRIKSDDWSKKFTDDGVGMFTAIYDINGNPVKTGYADERGFTVKGLENKLYFVYPADCNDCGNSKNDIMFKKWEDGSKDRPRLVPADSDLTVSYMLIVPEKRKLVPLIPPGETETAAKPEITLQAQDATYGYGWVQVVAQVENKVKGYDEILLSVYAPNGTLQDSFSYSDQQGFFPSREGGEGNYKIAATYKYDKGTAKAEITHPVKFKTPEFASLSAAEDNGTVRIGGLLKGGLAGENITIAVESPDGQTVKKYAMSFGTKPVFTLFIPSGEARAIFNNTGNFTFVVTHLPTGVQGNATLFHNATETETSAAALNVSNNSGKSERADLAVQGVDVYLVWQDDTPGQHEIMLAKSSDSGATFGKPVAIGKSQKGGFSLAPDITVSGKSVFIVWADYDSQEQSAVAFRWSTDSGKTFGNTSILGNYSGENADPHVAVFKGDIYVSWVTGANEEFTGDLVLARSSDGAAFEAVVVGKEASNPVMASSGDTMYLAWRHYQSGDTSTGNSSNIFASSSDGTNFETSEELQNMAIYSIAASGDNAYVAGARSENEDVIVTRINGNIFNNTSVASGSFPDIAATGDKVYVVWTDDENGLFFAASTDGGKTFGEKQSLGKEGFWPEVAADGSVFAAWTENSDIMVASLS